MKKSIISALALIVSTAAGAQQAQLELVEIKVGTLALKVELANEHDERVAGLMNRRIALPGMLFYYPEPRHMALWMKNTLIPLDAAYINEAGEIIDIIQLEPHDLTSRPAPDKVIAALEMPKGWFAKKGIKVGDNVSIPADVKAYY